MDTTTLLLTLAGALTLLSWIGLGWAIRRVFGKVAPLRPHWSLLAAIGMSFVIACGGFTNLFRITSPLALNLLTLLGLFAAAVALLSQPPRRPASFAWKIPLAFTGTLLCLYSAASTRFNPGDDQLAYLLFPQQMLQSGTLLAPFNLRRIGTYGGHQFLQAQLLAAAEFFLGPRASTFFVAHGNLLDTGLCSVIAAALLWSLLRPRSRSQLAFASLLVLLFLLTPISRVNTHAEMSGLALFLALFAILKTSPHRPCYSLSQCLLAGLIAAALATLRMNFLPAAVLAILFCAIAPFLPQRTFRARPIARSLLPLAVMLALLIPWSLVLLQSSGTPLYPILKGFQQGPFLEGPAAAALLPHLTWTLSILLYPPFFFLLLPLFIAPALPRLRPILPFYAAALLTTCATAWAYTQVDAATIYRYCSPLMLACAFASATLLLRQWQTLSPRYRALTLLWILLIPAVVSHDYSEAFRHGYPVLFAPALFLAALGPRFLPKPFPPLLLALLLLLIVQAAVINFYRVADSSGTFFYLFATAALVDFAITLPAGFPRRFLALFTAALAITALAALNHVEGPFLLGITLLLAFSLATIARQYPRPASPRRLLLLAVALFLVLLLGIVNLAFLLDSFGPLLLTASLAALAATAARTPSPILRPLALLGLTLLACAALPRPAFSTAHPADLHRYVDAQNSIPPHAPFFALVPVPTALDFARNPIAQADYELHFISPPPKLPRSGSPDDLRRYFLDRGIRYLMLSPAQLRSNSLGLPPDITRPLALLLITHSLRFNSPDVAVVDLAP